MFLDTSLNAASNVRTFEAMANQGHQITCVLPVLKEKAMPATHRLTIRQIAVHKLFPIVSYLYFSFRTLPDLVGSYKFDVVIINDHMLPWIVPIIVCRRFLRIGGNLTYAVREATRPVNLKTSRLYYQLFFRTVMLHLFRLCDLVFAVSPFHAAEVASKSGFPRVHVWPPSVDEQSFDPRRDAASRELIRNQLSLKGKFVLIYHGAMSHERGLYELLQAMVLIRKQAPEVMLLILGTGDAEARLRSIASDHELQGNVIFHKSVPYDEVSLFIAAADAGVVPLPVQPQWQHQTPIKLLEYLAMEKPVILTETDSHRWIIGKKGHAFFCGTGTPQEIARAVLECRAHQMPSMRDEIIARFSSSAIATEVLAVLGARSRQAIRS